MKEVNIVEVFEKFFLDFIGTIIPGCTFLFSLYLIIDIDKFDISEQTFFISNLWIFLIFIGYICGHALTSLGFIIIQIFEYILPCIGKTNSFKSKKELDKQIKKDPVFLLVKDHCKRSFGNKKLNIGSIRNLAMSINSPSDNQLIYRFMFISLFNLGVFTSLSLVNMIWVISYFLSKIAVPIIFDEYNLWISLLIVIISVPFLERRYSFFNRAIRVPFDMVFSKIQNDLGKNQKGKQYSVYLAGGFKSNWQDKVIKYFDNIIFNNPRAHNLKTPMEYTTWDLSAVSRSDIIFAFLEENNPGGYALALEIGYASALGKLIIFVDEKSKDSERNKNNLNMVRECSHVVFENLNQGIDYLKKYQ